MIIEQQELRELSEVAAPDRGSASSAARCRRCEIGEALAELELEVEQLEELYRELESQGVELVETPRGRSRRRSRRRSGS